MDIEERAALVSARLKSAVYPGDRADAIRQALVLASEDSFVAGTRILSELAELAKDAEAENPPELYEALSKILQGKSGEEFTDILAEKEGFLQKVLDFLSWAPGDRSFPFQVPKHVSDLVVIISQRKKQELSQALIRSPDRDKILAAAGAGHLLALEVLAFLLEHSGSLRQILVFGGFIESMMDLSVRGKERAEKRQALRSLAEITGRSLEAAQYFLEMPWRKWADKVSEKDPHHFLRLIYSLASHSPVCPRLVPETKRFLLLGDVLSIYLLTSGAYEAVSALGKSKNRELLRRIQQDSVASKCAARWNCLIGLEYNCLDASRDGRGAGEKGELGSPQALAQIYSGTLQPEETEVAVLLYSLQNVHGFSLFRAVVYFKTCLALLFRDVSPLLCSREILGEVRETLEAENTHGDVRGLCAAWLLLAYVRASEEERSEISVFSNLNYRILPYMENLISSFVTGRGTICGTKSCRRCYLSEVLASRKWLPRPAQKVMNALWMPQEITAYIISSYTEYLSLASREKRRAKHPDLDLSSEEEAREKVESSPTETPTPRPTSFLGNVFDL